MRNGLKVARKTIAQWPCIFNFLPLQTFHYFLSGLSRKLKDKLLGDLCDSSDLSGRSSQSEA